MKVNIIRALLATVLLLAGLAKASARVEAAPGAGRGAHQTPVDTAGACLPCQDA